MIVCITMQYTILYECLSTWQLRFLPQFALLQHGCWEKVICIIRITYLFFYDCKLTHARLATGITICFQVVCLQWQQHTCFHPEVYNTYVQQQINTPWLSIRFNWCDCFCLKHPSNSIAGKNPGEKPGSLCFKER